ncbi:hypothetical protein BJX99DRAFT_269532 [Aspergillus californicus]
MAEAQAKTPRTRIRPSRGRGLRTSTGCLTCRERRVKCDDGKPKCMRCTKSRRVCRYAQGAGQRNAGAGAGAGAGGVAGGGNKSEKSIPQSSQETRRLPQISVETPHDPFPDIPVQDPGPTLDIDIGSPDLGLGSSALSDISLLNISPFEWYDLLARDAITNIQRLNDASADGPRWNFPEITLSRRQSPIPEYPEAAHLGPGQLETPLLDYHQLSEPWNTRDRIELSALDLVFLRYYTDVVGPILDLFDPGRHFTNVVPHLGLRNIGLLKSILAVGAKHMSLGHMHSHTHPSSPHTASPPPSAQTPDAAHMATQYYYETLQYLSQTMLYPLYADSREILATSIMISTYEMFDASRSTSGDWERHLRGSFWIQRSQDNDGESADGLRRAVWWAWLRQDIWAAFQAGRPTLTIWRAKRRLEELDADELATRILYICAKCVEFAASESESAGGGDGMAPDQQDPRSIIEQGDRLLGALEDWVRVLPASYSSVAVVDSASVTTPQESRSTWNGSPEQQQQQQQDPCTPKNPIFPPIWIHPPSHAAAMQMYHFARAVVLLNQPTMGGLTAYRVREKQLAESVQMVCGIANACQEHECASAFVNVQTLFGVGQFVQSPEMRAELLRTLENMLRISKFPDRGLVAELQRVWQGD